MQLSYWEKNTFFSNVDATIIGSGIVGLSAAIELKNKYPNWKILVLERGVLPNGASTKNAGFACFGSPSEVLDDLKTLSEEQVFNLVKRRWEGLQNLRSLLSDEDIGFQHFGSYELFSEQEVDLFNECSRKINYLNKQMSSVFGGEVYQIEDDKISDFQFGNVSHIIKNNFEGQIDTGKMMSNLLRLAHSKGIIILNGMEVKQFSDTNADAEIELPNFSFKTKNLIVATNGFAKTILPKLNVNPARAQVVITNEIENLPFKGTFHIEKGYYYFRNVGKRVLFGGGRNLAFEEETTTEMQTTELIQNKLEELLSSTILPNFDYQIDQRWTGIMGVGDAKTTIVKQQSDNVYLAVRMGGMGVAIGSLVGREVADLV